MVTPKCPLGDLSFKQNRDGSISFRNNFYNENFNSSIGPRKEALKKFVVPSEIERFEQDHEIKILDVCFGVGYNSACLIEAMNIQSIKVHIWGLEIDRRPVDIVANNLEFINSWSNDVQQIYKSIKRESKWSNSKGSGKILWGDAREEIKKIQKDIYFDLIFLDPFSPTKCPMLWSEEFIKRLTMRLVKGGRLITYSTAAAIRASLRRSGMEIRSIKPIREERKSWSTGTIAISPKNNLQIKNHSKSWKKLNMMEEDHLLSKAAIPYRDPSGTATSVEILKRRQQEQMKSQLKSSKEWKQRWREALPSFND